jgi:hypothetical protein
MTDCTERSEGREGMPGGGNSMTDCTERSEGREGMRGGGQHDRLHRAQRGPGGHARRRTA